MTETFHGFVDTAFDALLLFDACCDGRLPRVQRRFGDRERQSIRSGAVYVWDEEETGMRRWTDGRTWSPSRVHGCFLIYYELEGRRHQFVNRNCVVAPRQGRGSPRAAQSKGSASPSASSLFASYDPCPPNVMQKEQGLVKKALSLCTSNKKRLHLVCYYSREDVESGRLVSPSSDPMFAGADVREERYPELTNGQGRFDRYGGGRARSSGGSRQWKVPSPESAARRDGAAAHARSEMAVEARANPYGHVGYGQYSAQACRADGLAISVAGPGAPSMPPPPPPPQHQQHQQQLLPQPPHVRMYGLSSPCAVVADSPRSAGGEYCLEMPAVPLAAAPYIQHMHVYSTAPHPSMVPKQHQQHQPYRWQHQQPHLALGQAPAVPVWQHSEPPRAYATPLHGNFRRASHVTSTEAPQHDAGSMGPAIQVRNGGAPPFGQPQPPVAVVLAAQQSALTLPPIARLSVGSALTDGWGKGGDSSARMTSEDMRQLAALRLSLH
ncbi:Gluconate transport-inducing protein [Coemansia nantahalensis]|uniref:Gluconate transport-inducing protein n=1 Tax=Coemansia nantahalensis TaxID=2789366 RepID=A0ACC1JXX5_9FUNG|nr:Gluconate transport-inducing protein [Coemansia nantahalensis]KAJ2773602.1 Gluconate transport-inducing protein [Coemansia nantahalensis]